ncbi:carboxy-cis,cis-muconate cyclase [Metarhizium guizhouense ARSEF 977]|uniref:Carboxy-cis,cis-muconate cyclase n=1 Tax=Metarhizium guizhouense (strain ARSEF 977) TaxID=1276136 RepID=A0A0B4HR85_METGA|nr:carboxy-cis,cis-muconate cyclase [Metarhizium guizhouense ARSEF 977]
MLTRLLLVAAAATASALPSSCRNNNNAVPGKMPNSAVPSVAKLLITSPGNISIAEFDGTKFDIKSTKGVSGNPTWVAFSQPHLYAVDENSDTTSLLKVDLAGNKIDQLSSTKGSSGVVHLEFTKDKSQMVGAGFGSSNIDIFDISNGGLKFSNAIKSDDKPGPNTVRQEKPHPHQSVLDPSGRFMAVNDLGTDKILVLDTQKAFAIVNRVSAEPGAGPRHGAFFPAGANKATHYFVLCEIKNLVLVYALKYGGDKGIEFELKQTISTFKSVEATPAEAAAGELVLAADNKNVYVSNRLTGGQTDNIANFRIDQNGGELKLELVGFTSTGGLRTRMFSASLDGQHLFVGNQDGALGVVALKRNADGTLVEKPVASLDMSLFPGQLAGPAFVQQVA